MLHPIKKVLAAGAALAALALGGSAIAGAATSSTAASSSTPATATQAPSSAQAPPALHGPAHGTAAHESAEKTVTGDAAAKAQAAAVKSVGGGTAGAVTSDMTGHGFETTVTKANGAKVEVHLDSSYHVMQGPRGPGAPGGHGGPGAPPAAGYGG